MAPGGTFDVKLVPAPFAPDGNPKSDGTLSEVSNLVSRIAVPAGTSLTSYEIGSWSNVGAGTPSASGILEGMAHYGFACSPAPTLQQEAA